MQFRIEASKCIADRALGRPTQPVDATVAGAGIVQMAVFTGVPRRMDELSSASQLAHAPPLAPQIDHLTPDDYDPLGNPIKPKR
jgi:hypothetical protein